MRYLFLLLISSICFSQQTSNVDFKVLTADLVPNEITKSISGKVTYEFEVLSEIDIIKIDAIDMKFNKLTINKKEVNFIATEKQLVLTEGFKKGKNVLYFEYEVTPKQALYFNGNGSNLQIWTQGQGKNTSNWLPSFDDVNEKVIFNLSLTFDKSFYALTNGELKNKDFKPNDTKWTYEMKKPMSSYLVALVISKYEKQIIYSDSKVPIELYLGKIDDDKFESTYKYTKDIFDFLEKKIGVDYPWEVYRQAPVRDFLYAGMENTTFTIFSDEFVVDAVGFNDKNYVNVNAHELAHQWFGNLVTAKESKHHWLQEGFATYYALLAEREVFGDDYFNNELLKMAEQLREASLQDDNPILSDKASSLSLYKKGAWALFVIQANIGESKFDKAVKNYLKKYQYGTVETDDFLAEIKNVSDYDVESFKKKWLENAFFDWNEAMNCIKDSKFMKDYLAVRQLETVYFNNKKVNFNNILQEKYFHPIYQEIVYQLKEIPYLDKRELVFQLFALKDIKAKQTLAESFQLIPKELKTEYEKMFADHSYINREIALYKLWTTFREDRERYIDISRTWVGQDYNLRFAHLILKAITFKNDKVIYSNTIAELEQMTREEYNITVREKAIENLLQLNEVSDVVLTSLIDLSSHIKWQAVKFSKDTLRKLLKNSDVRNQLTQLKGKSSSVQKDRIDYFLSE
ncbi:M1 family metallopeptidase [uncultured Flavobacterium sp.]|uniref:M1 family metallopeptidase n=1 Tax=uncultured Flavobacterium sp. TaxID=165435 RepID=UPI0030EC6A19|tara:strand:- start:226384 stop:228444 length:2061 start_codon:yes stop_codon:yes gene_type:complete